MAIKSINPYNDKVLKVYDELTEAELNEKIEFSKEAFDAWRRSSFDERRALLKNLSRLFLENKKELAELATLEMGKTIKESLAEVEKCAWAFEYYAEHGEEQLREIEISTDATKSYVKFEPLGPILLVMPWNFPYWQVVRAMSANLMAGNTILLKHASNVPQVAMKLEELTKPAGMANGVFQTLLISSSRVEQVIAHKAIRGVALTGSEYAGSQVAMHAGKYIKPSILELGGSDPFIVLPDADMDMTIKNAVLSRLGNSGQVCNAAKRFIVHNDVYEEFTTKLKIEFEKIKIGDPMDEETQMGPIVNESGLKELSEQIKDAVSNGSELLTGGVEGKFCKPTILTNVSKEMRIYSEETFGPIASVFKFENTEDAIEIANDTEFGLGASIWTKDMELAKSLIGKLEVGGVYINKLVHSHPHLPFGGVKNSGYGRELSEFGIRSFVNIKTVFIK